MISACPLSLRFPIPNCVIFDLTQLLVSEQKIAITGIAGGGKTVFLTSLLSHLIEHDPYHFAFGQQARVSGFREKKVRPRYGGRLRLDAYRDMLSRRQQWPAKTTDCAHYRCSFERSDWSYARQRLHFFDLPGERIADAAIAAHDSFAEWSDHMLDHFRDHAEYTEPSQAYLDLQHSRDLTASELVAAYKRALAQLILAYKPLISPSTFLLDRSGQPAQAQDADMLAQTQFSGLPDAEFAPVGSHLRESHPGLYQRLSEHYLDYRRTVALPVFEELRECSRLIVLVDIPSLLLGGDGRYNDNRLMLHELFEALRPGSLLANKLLSLFGLNLWPLKRVALVASKADMVHPLDVENGRLLGLLHQMTDRVRQVLPAADFEWFVCSACVSTRTEDGDHRLIGRPSHVSESDAGEMAFDVSELPESWPASWQPGDYQFSRVMPQAPRNLQIPPPHIGLDQVFDYITSD